MACLSLLMSSFEYELNLYISKPVKNNLSLTQQNALVTFVTEGTTVNFASIIHWPRTAELPVYRVRMDCLIDIRDSEFNTQPERQNQK